MAKEAKISIDGRVIDVIKDEYKVELEIAGAKPDVPKPIVTAHVSGKMRIHTIRVLTGDRVTVEFSPYDLTRGRITKRLKD